MTAPDALGRDPRVAPRCGDCGACALCDAVLAYEDRVQAPRDAHEAPPAHEPADDPRRHHGGPVVDVAGGHRDAAAPRLGVEERQLAATRMVRRFAQYTTLRAAVEEALSANERRCLDDADDRTAVVGAVLEAIAASPDAMFVRELLGTDRLSWLSRAMAHGMTAQRLVDAAMRLSGGE